MKIHIGNMPPRQNAPMFRMLTIFILKEIEWGFRKYMSTKIPGMVHQGLLVPQGLITLRILIAIECSISSA